MDGGCSFLDCLAGCTRVGRAFVGAGGTISLHFSNVPLVRMRRLPSRCSSTITDWILLWGSPVSWKKRLS